ncbi:O-antigen ligase family protein [Micromonospora sp. CB01531]|uniref:O-antigen ligase family protein n=1 Tax=Micromonospora sp. CB01531 TaxID=1718947 RepID=UPI0011610553|nr:O-antigen ligase family protein [Micromonospora sp. CB01531]
MLVVGLLLVQALADSAVAVLAGADGDDAWASVDRAARWSELAAAALYVLLAALTAGKVVLDRQWRHFATGADLALLALGFTMALAGVANDSSAALTGQALLAYLRAVLVFYALRAADPGPVAVRRLLTVVGVVVAANVAVALGEAAAGFAVDDAAGVGSVDQGAVRALLADSVELGNVLGLALVGCLAWAAGGRTVGRMWWAAVALVALALSATESSGSVVGVLLAAVVVAVTARRGAARVLGVVLLLVLCVGAQVALNPDRHASWEARLGIGVSRVDGAAIAAPTDFPRVADVLARQPLLGCGPGQLTSIGAGEGGSQCTANQPFEQKGFSHSFWFRLLIETGVLGFAAFVAWLFLVIRPLRNPARRRPRRESPGPPHFIAIWGIAAVVFAAVVAVLSPSVESPMLSVLLWTVVGIAWWVRRRSQEAERSLFAADTAFIPKVRDPADVHAVDTRILGTDEILSLARQARRRTDRGN